MAELAVARDACRMPCLGLEGYVEKVTGGARTMTAPQPCRRINALKIGEVDGVLRVGEFDVLVGERGGVPEISARRRRRRGAPGHHDRAPRRHGRDRRRPGPGAVMDATFLPAGNRGAGRPGKWGPEAGKGDNHKLAATCGTRARRMLVGVPASDRTGDGAAFGPAVTEPGRTGALRRGDGEGPPIHGDGAHGPRKNFAAARRAGCRLRAPIRVTDSGRSDGTGGGGGSAGRHRAGSSGSAARRRAASTSAASGARTS